MKGRPVRRTATGSMGVLMPALALPPRPWLASAGSDCRDGSQRRIWGDQFAELPPEAMGGFDKKRLGALLQRPWLASPDQRTGTRPCSDERFYASRIGNGATLMAGFQPDQIAAMDPATKGSKATSSQNCHRKLWRVLMHGALEHFLQLR